MRIKKQQQQNLETTRRILVCMMTIFFRKNYRCDLIGFECTINPNENSDGYLTPRNGFDSRLSTSSFLFKCDAISNEFSYKFEENTTKIRVWAQKRNGG